MHTEIRLTIVMQKRLLALFAFVLIGSTTALAQKNSSPPHGTKGTVVHVANLYAQADESAARVSAVTPGRELVIAERSDKWLRSAITRDRKSTRLNSSHVLTSRMPSSA